MLGTEPSLHTAPCCYLGGRGAEWCKVASTVALAYNGVKGADPLVYPSRGQSPQWDPVADPLVWGSRVQSPQWGPGANPLVCASRGQSPLKLKA